METNIKLNIGEFLDRMSISVHKTQKIGKECYPEFLRFCEELLLNIPIEKFEEIIKGFRQLYFVNGEIWKLESDLRKGKEKKLGLSEVGRRAIKIREWNKKRVTEQNRLIRLFGGYENIKKDHASE